jgi:hypothetical protein
VLDEIVKQAAGLSLCVTPPIADKDGTQFDFPSPLEIRSDYPPQGRLFHAAIGRSLLP